MRARILTSSLALASLISFGAGTASFADEVVTHSETTTTRSTPDVIVDPPPAAVVVEHNSGCVKHTETRTDAVTGDSETRKSVSCD